MCVPLGYGGFPCVSLGVFGFFRFFEVQKVSLGHFGYIWVLMGICSFPVGLVDSPRFR